MSISCCFLIFDCISIKGELVFWWNMDFKDYAYSPMTSSHTWNSSQHDLKLIATSITFLLSLVLFICTSVYHETMIYSYDLQSIEKHLTDILKAQDVDIIDSKRDGVSIMSLMKITMTQKSFIIRITFIKVIN